MQLSKSQIRDLQKVVDGLDVLQEIAQQLLLQMNQGTVTKDTAFLTAREAIVREARKEVLNKFFQNVEALAREHV